VAVATIDAASASAFACASATLSQLTPTTRPIRLISRLTWYGAVNGSQGVGSGAKIGALIGSSVAVDSGVTVGAGVALGVGWAVTVGIVVVAGASGADAPKSVEYDG
jgi:hypothetical protein